MNGDAFVRARWSTVPCSPAQSMAHISFVPKNNLIRRRQRQFFGVFLQWQDRKVFVPARFTPKCRQMQQSPQECTRAVHVVTGNSLQLMISADRTMRMQRFAQRHGARAKSSAAILAPPRINPRQAKEVVCNRTAARASHSCLFTHRADHRVRWTFPRNGVSIR
jgi:hypothetical protein